MSSQDSKYNEKRSETRFPINSEVSITLPDNKIAKGVCCNISGSGMLIKTDSDISVDDAVSLNITEGKIDFNADAVVVRVVEDSGSTLVAVKISKQLD